MRDGVPLPGLTPEQVTSQLVHRVIGPLRPDIVRAILDFHGLAGAPAVGAAATAGRSDTVSAGMLRTHTSRVRAAGRRVPLTAPVITATIRPSRLGEDHLGRIRIAGTLKLPSPPPLVLSQRTGGGPTPADRATGRSAARLLAVTGPLELTALLAAINRRRRWRGAPLSQDRMTDALLAVGATRTPDGRWAAPPGQLGLQRYHRIVAAAAGRELNRAQVAQILEEAGYARSSATGLMAATHPLLVRTGRDRYRIIAAPTDTD